MSLFLHVWLDKCIHCHAIYLSWLALAKYGLSSCQHNHWYLC